MDLLHDMNDGEDDYDMVFVGFTRRRRLFLPRINFNLEDPYFKEKFRMPKTCVEYLVERLGRFLLHPTNCNAALTPLQQILITLHWLGNGSQYHGAASMHGISKASVCRCVNNVCSRVARHLLCNFFFFMFFLYF